MSFFLGWLTGVGLFFFSVWTAVLLSATPHTPTPTSTPHAPQTMNTVMPEIPHRVFYLSGEEQFFLQLWAGTGTDNTAFYYRKGDETIFMGTCRMNADSVRRVNFWESWTWTDGQGKGYRTWWWPEARRLSVIDPHGQVFWVDLDSPGGQGLPQEFWQDLIRRWQPGIARSDIHTPLRDRVLGLMEKK